MSYKIKISKQTPERLEFLRAGYVSILHEYETLQTEYDKDPVSCRKQAIDNYMVEHEIWLVRKLLKGILYQIERMT